MRTLNVNETFETISGGFTVTIKSVNNFVDQPNSSTDMYYASLHPCDESLTCEDFIVVYNPFGVALPDEETLDYHRYVNNISELNFEFDLS